MKSVNNLISSKKKENDTITRFQVFILFDKFLNYANYLFFLD